MSKRKKKSSGKASTAVVDAVNAAGEEAGVPHLEEQVDLKALFGEAIERFDDEQKRWVAVAYETARRAHGGVKRASGEPYIGHPVEATKILLRYGLDWQSLCASLLHDTIEDTSITYQELREHFPDPIADLVMGVTKISSLNFRSSHEEQVENLRKMILAMSQDIRVILIKLADRLHNIQTLDALSQAKQKKVARSTLEIYAPLAGRLGMYRIKSQLEDGAMRYLYPEAYRELAQRIEEKRDERERHIQNSIEFLRKELKIHGIDAEVTGRSKHFWSIYNKMRRQSRSFEEIYDLNAMRIICNTKAECYEILGVIHNTWKPVPEHFSDYIALPKANLYQSIHTKVIGLNGKLTEIQIRTREMHHVAEEGIAAHWSYKEGKSVSKDNQERLAWLRQMVGWIQDANDPGELLNDLKRDALDDKVFCFTPKGDVIEMQKGATVLDLAYRIHTDLGHRCTGGKINQKFVPLRTPIRMGDIVEIVTSKTPHPSPDWLKVVTTARARAKIRHALKQRDFEKNVAIGREMIRKAFARADVHVSTQELSDVLDLHFKGLNVKSVEDLYAEVGFGTIPTTMVVGRLIPQEKTQKRKVKKKKSAKPDDVLVDGMPGSLTRLAQCCKPQPGDAISGFVTRGRGVSIHRSDCAHLHRWMAQSPDHVHRFVPVAWSGEGEAKHRRYGIRILAEDRTGILAELTQTISQMQVSIQASSSRSNAMNHQAVVRFTVLVPDEDQLMDIIAKLQDVSGVLTVDRDERFR
ncbi:MAG: RelA/SpoT family protein [Candidatus Sumerlaeota bacterium]